MRQKILFLCASLFLLILLAPRGAGQDPYRTPSCVMRAAQPFTVNEGQYPADVLFHARTLGGAVFVTAGSEIVYALPSSGGAAGGWGLRERPAAGSFRMPRGADPAPTRVSFFMGKAPAAWKGGLPTYRTVEIGAVYPGIEMSLHAREGRVEKVFRVRPGADPGRIRVRMEGASSLSIDQEGRLLAETGCGDVLFTRPAAYQEIGGRRRLVAVRYTVDRDTYGFSVGPYDRTAPLVIDPLLASTFLGGEDSDRGLDLVTDEAGCVYVAGYTRSTGFPATPGAFDEEHNGGYDAFLCKLTPDLDNLLAATYLGGTKNEGWFYAGLALDDDGNIYVTGNTASPDFPVTAGAYDETYNGNMPGGPYGNGGDVFVAKLNQSLDKLLAATFIGGSSFEYCRSIALAGDGGPVLAGSTASPDFPVTAGAYGEAHQPGGSFGMDLFVSGLDKDLAALKASTYVGGNADDYCEAMDLDAGGAVYLAGWTASKNYPVTPGAFDETYNGYYYDAFVSRLTGDLTALPASTFLGGESWDFAYSMIVDGKGDVFVTGHTASKDAFPTTPGAYDTTYNGPGGAGVADDIFLSRFDGSLASLKASTFLGGTQWENGTSLALDGEGGLYLAGSSTSPDFPMGEHPFDGTYNGGIPHYGDVVLVKLDTDLSALHGSTYLGGSGADGGYVTSLCLGKAGDLYVSGSTGSSNFPATSGAFQGVNGGGEYDVFVSRLDPALTADPLAADGKKISAAVGGEVHFDLFAGPQQAGRGYVLLGTVSGTEPGLPLPGGAATLPLNWDGFTHLVHAQMNSPFFVDFTGVLDGEGAAAARLDTLGPVHPGCVGLRMHFAYALLNHYPWDYASNPVKVRIDP